MKFILGVFIEKLVSALIKLAEKWFRDTVQKEKKKAEKKERNEKELANIKNAQEKADRIKAARDLLNGL